MNLSLALGCVFIGYGMIVIGIALGVGLISATAILGMTRQPELAGKLTSSTFVFAAIIEGIGLLALILCMSSATSLIEIITKQVQ